MTPKLYNQDLSPTRPIVSHSPEDSAAGSSSSYIPLSAAAHESLQMRLLCGSISVAAQKNVVPTAFIEAALSAREKARQEVRVTNVRTIQVDPHLFHLLAGTRR
jgi:hypothetical protein